jgi:hypothetical protein
MRLLKTCPRQQLTSGGWRRHTVHVVGKKREWRLDKGLLRGQESLPG